MRQNKLCFRCNKNHDSQYCFARNWECFKCGRRGHTSRACPARGVNLVEDGDEAADSGTITTQEGKEEEEPLDLGFIANLNVNECEKSLKVKLVVEGRKIQLEVHSGASKSVIYHETYRRYFSHCKLQVVSFALKVVTSQAVRIQGQILVNVNFKNKLYPLPLVVLESTHKFAPLLRRN